jgi:hypothetical protein
MFCKSTRILAPAIVALTVCVSLSSTEVFAKGGMGGSKGKPGMGREHRDRDHFRRDFRYNRYWDRFSFGYPCYGCVEAPVCSCEVAVPEVVVKPVEVVAKPVVAEVPVCTTCEPCATVGGCGPEFGYGWGFRHDHKPPRREYPLTNGGRMGGNKKK